LVRGELLTTRGRIALVFLATLAVITLVESSLLALGILVALWAVTLRPLAPVERGAFVVAPPFFLGMNYVVLAGGGFVFRSPDVLLQPWWEPPIWGFWYVVIHRWSGPASVRSVPPPRGRALVALVATAAAFGSGLEDPTAMLLAGLGSTAVVLALYHERGDLSWAATALAVGTMVELAGVLGGAWHYPRSHIFGIPLWFLPMWVTAGVLGRRILVPLAAPVGRRLGRDPVPSKGERCASC